MAGDHGQAAARAIVAKGGSFRSIGVARGAMRAAPVTICHDGVRTVVADAVELRRASSDEARVSRQGLSIQPSTLCGALDHGEARRHLLDACMVLGDGQRFYLYRPGSARMELHHGRVWLWRACARAVRRCKRSGAQVARRCYAMAVRHVHACTMLDDGQRFHLWASQVGRTRWWPWHACL
jgi:hypothetical protein